MSWSAITRPECMGVLRVVRAYKFYRRSHRQHLADKHARRRVHRACMGGEDPDNGGVAQVVLGPSTVIDAHRRSHRRVEAAAANFVDATAAPPPSPSPGPV